MKLIFIYGPPAVGKLTVATELAKITGFKLFHNHVSIQFVQSIFEFGTKTFWRLIDKFRLEMLEEASKEEVDTIFTFVYSRGTDDDFVRNAIHRVRSHGGRVCLVRLHCDEQTLAMRVKAKDRRRMGKISTKSKLRGVLKKYDLASEVPFQSSVGIDTTDKSPRKVAELVTRHYKLHVLKEALPS